MNATSIVEATVRVDSRPSEHARRLILKQHTDLRRLLALGLVNSVGLLDNRISTSEPFRALVTVIRDLFTRHVADEEALILSPPEANRAPDRTRAERLRSEHAYQRAELDALCAWAEDASDLALAARFDRLARALLLDIADEERDLLIAAPTS
jgi:hypothetical protein